MSWTCVRDEGQAVIIAQSKNIFAELLTNEKIVCNIQILNGTVRFDRITAGWSSPVARQAHNLKVVGSNPAPATKEKKAFEKSKAFLFCLCGTICPTIVPLF